LFSVPEGVEQAKDIHPFLLVSLANVEGRPPGIIFGLIHKLAGQEKDDRKFAEIFLLWLNERLEEICRSASHKEYGWELEQELVGTTEVSRLKAQVSFHKDRLFDITDENLAERGRVIADWFKDRLPV